MWPEETWEDEEDLCEECGEPLDDGGPLCEQCQRRREAEDLLEEIERASIVSIFFLGPLL